MGLDGHALLIRSALKRTPLQYFNSFSIMFYNIISSIYQKIGDLFCPVIFLDFCTVCLQNLGIILEKDPNFKKLIKNYFQNNKDDF
jgi:hypothetical protein